MKAAEQARGCPEHQSIDHEEKQPDRHDGHGQRQHHEDGPQHRVEQADDQRRDHGRAEAVDLHATIEIGHDQQGTGAEQPFDQDFHAGSIAAAGRSGLRRRTGNRGPENSMKNGIPFSGMPS
ncbi:hypothetical protein GY14_16990 [Delftia tsuruhatensis]|nr:hypothetical protein GY14_16990 [Delftia tsuruhatensis]